MAPGAWLWLTPGGRWEVFALRPSVLPGSPLSWVRIPCGSAREALAVQERLAAAHPSPSPEAA